MQNIEQRAEETNTHLEAGNVHVDKAVGSARAARKKKWICLGICGEFLQTTVTLSTSLRHNGWRFEMMELVVGTPLSVVLY